MTNHNTQNLEEMVLLTRLEVWIKCNALPTKKLLDKINIIPCNILLKEQPQPADRNLHQPTFQSTICQGTFCRPHQ